MTYHIDKKSFHTKGYTMSDLAIRFIDVATNWGNLPHQQSAVTWLQSQIENKNLHDNLAWEFARAYRDSDNGSAINFVNVFEFYQALPHQNVALSMLQDGVINDTLAEFTTLWRTSPPKPQHINIDVPWYFQRTNRTCFSASVAMMGSNNSQVFRDRFPTQSTENGYQRYVRELHQSWGDTTDPNSHIRLLTSLGLTPTFRTDMSLAQMMELTLRGTAVAFGFLHRGSMANPQGGGHWACCRGFTEDRNFIIVNDPFGSLNDGYTGDINNGRNVRYSRAQMNNRFTVETPGQDSRHGWALYI